MVTYDIETLDREGERRLAAVAKVCEGYGLRVQKSVFECRLSAAAYERFVGDVRDVIDPEVDSVNVYVMVGDVEFARRSLGRPPPVTPGGPWIV